MFEWKRTSDDDIADAIVIVARDKETGVYVSWWFKESPDNKDKAERILSSGFSLYEMTLTEAQPIISKNNIKIN